MTINLSSQRKQAIQAAIDAGLIRSADELIDSAIARLPRFSTAGAEAGNLFELLAPVRGLLTDEEIDRSFGRKASEGRPV